MKKREVKKKRNGGEIVRFRQLGALTVTIPGKFYMPEKLFHTMTFCSDWHETTAGGFVCWTYRGNSIWDPQFAVGGESAYGEAAMAGIYLYYKVLSSKIYVEVGNESADTLTVAIVPTTMSNALTDKEDITSMPRAVYRLTNAGGPILRLANAMATAPMLGMKGYDENGLTGTHAAGDPTNCWFWQVVFSNTTAEALDSHVRLRIEYQVMEYGLKTVEQ
jgi:hypothetical protein